MHVLLLLVATAFGAPSPRPYFEPYRDGYLARVPGHSVYLTAGGVALDAITLRFPGAKPVTVEALDPGPGYSSYFVGRDPAQWRTRVPHYSRVRYRELYPGIDAIFRFTEGQVEYDFILAAHADPAMIRMAWTGAKPALTAAGALQLGGVVQLRPRVFQGAREVDASYRIAADQVALSIAPYDRELPLTVDPVIVFNRQVGVQTDTSSSIAADAAGNSYVAGITSQPSFPATDGAYDTTHNGLQDAYVAKVAPDGAVVWASFLGGMSREYSPRVAVDANGSPYVAGLTESGDFPMRSAFRSTLVGKNEFFLTKFAPDGASIIYSTYFGGSGDEGQLDASNAVIGAYGLTVDGAGSAYLAGANLSGDLPISSGLYGPTAPGFAHVFVAKFEPSGNALAYCTTIGGSNRDVANAVAVDGSGHAYVTGYTLSADFPTTTGAYSRTNRGLGDAFVVKINPSASAIVYSTLLGGTRADIGQAIAVDAAGRAAIAGTSASSDLPIPAGAFQQPPSTPGTNRGFVARLNSNGSRLMSASYLSGSAGVSFTSMSVLPGGQPAIGVQVLSPSGDYPVTADAIPAAAAGADAAVSVLNPAYTALNYSTRLNGSTAAISSSQSDLFVTTTSTGVLAIRIALTLPDCIGTLAPASATVPAAGSGLTVTVTTPATCRWFALPGSTDVPATPSTAVVGTGAFSATVGANPDSLPRTFSITAANAILPIIQAGTSTTAPFADVPLTHPFVHHIALMKSNAITSGCTATTYCPDAPATRSQMAVFIIRALHAGDAFPFSSTPYFTDVPPEHPHFKWVQKMRELGITSGCTATTYCPDSPVNRGQMAVFIVRGIAGNTFSSQSAAYFTDVPLSHPFFRYIQKMKEFGITTGTSATTYSPDDPVTRGQMGVFIIRGFATAR